MAYNDQEGLIDIFDGMGDLRRGQIRCVGDPEERFTEDALRILRAVRFSAQIGFSVESRTRAALSQVCSESAQGKRRENPDGASEASCFSPSGKNERGLGDRDYGSRPSGV